MQSVLFTNSQYIKSVTPLDDNLGDKFILPALRQAQNEDYRCIIGDALYNKLSDILNNKEINREENAAYKDLLDRSQTFLAYATMVKVIPMVSYKVGNIGINRTHDENIEYTTMSEMFQLQDYFEDTRDFQKKQIQHFLLNNHKAFPELNECACNAIRSNLHAADSSNIFLGGARGKRR